MTRRASSTPQGPCSRLDMKSFKLGDISMAAGEMRGNEERKRNAVKELWTDRLLQNCG